MPNGYYAHVSDFDAVTRRRQKRDIEKFLDNLDDEPMIPMLLEALKKDLEDRKIAIKLAGSIDDYVIEIILDHCRSATPTDAIEAMKRNDNDIGLAISMLQKKEDVIVIED